MRRHLLRPRRRRRRARHRWHTGGGRPSVAQAAGRSAPDEGLVDGGVDRRRRDLRAGPGSATGLGTLRDERRWRLARRRARAPAPRGSGHQCARPQSRSRRSRARAGRRSTAWRKSSSSAWLGTDGTRSCARWSPVPRRAASRYRDVAAWCRPASRRSQGAAERGVRRRHSAHLPRQDRSGGAARVGPSDVDPVSDAWLSRPAGWRPSPLVIGSAGLHGVALARARVPHSWQLMLAALVGNHVVLSAAGMFPRCGWLGPNITRLPDGVRRRRGVVALTFDDGPDPEVTPAVLDLLDQARARATFFCVGRRAEAHPDHRGRDPRARTRRREPHLQPLERIRVSGTAGTPTGSAVRAQAAIERAGGGRPRVLSGARRHSESAGCRWRLPRPGSSLVSWTRRGFDTVTRDGAESQRACAAGFGAAIFCCCTTLIGARRTRPPRGARRAAARARDDGGCVACGRKHCTSPLATQGPRSRATIREGGRPDTR